MRAEAAWPSVRSTCSGPSTSLLVFAVPMLTPKGGTVHRRVGWVFVGAMGTAAVTAAAMTLAVLADPTSSPGRRASAWFLLFISVMSANSSWFGLRVLRFKRHGGAHRSPADLGAIAVLLGAAVATSAYGFGQGAALLAWFPLLGVFLGLSQLAYWRRAPALQQQWWLEHMGGMFTACIGTITAFLVAGMPRFATLDVPPLALWLAPTVTLVPLLIGWQAYYRRRFTQRGA